MEIPSSPAAQRQLIREQLSTDLILNPEAAARSAQLHYVSDRTPGYSRKRWGRGFSYFTPTGDRIQDADLLNRLKAINIPPSWQQVWICADPNGHLQATGRDPRGRKQYRYHPDWVQLRSQAKFERLVPFGLALLLIRQTCDRHLSQPQITREKMLAVVVRLLDETLIRVGNSEYARKNESYGLTTLRDRHVEVFSSRVRFEFTGKRGVHHEIELCDRRLARAVKRCQEILGYELFQYFDEEGQKQTVDSGDVNQYLQAITGHDSFTAKEFRTWTGTVNAATALQAMGKGRSDAEAKQNLVEAVKQVAQQLGNRPATCRKYYIHPLVLEAYRSGELLDRLATIQANSQKVDGLLEEDELAVLLFLAEST
ncbi:DNA topoisomerase I [filamentous cyanobacterium CCP5]|nr:DNA topoisomerase I [filamentous cyanobacterium CCP5]